MDCNICFLIWSWSVCSGLYQDEDHGSLLDRSPRWWIGAAPQDTFQHKPPDRSRLPQTPRPTGKTQCQQNVMRIENDTVNRVPKSDQVLLWNLCHALCFSRWQIFRYATQARAARRVLRVSISLPGITWSRSIRTLRQLFFTAKIMS